MLTRRALSAAASDLPWNGRAERCILGTMGSGYHSLWVLATSQLLALTERPDGSRMVLSFDQETRQRVTLTRATALGPLAIAVPKDEDEAAPTSPS